MKVFVLSSSAHRRLHQAIQSFLGIRGIAVWVDAAVNGSNYSERLAEWFRESDLIIVLATPGYLASESCRKEWIIASQCSTPKLVLRFRGQKLPGPSQAVTVLDCADEAEAPQLVYEFIRSKQRMKVFISYSHKNASDMKEILELVKQSLNKVWVDGSGLKHGEDFPEKIRREIEACDYFLLIWSRHSRASRWVEQEWNYAFKLGKRIVPLLLDLTPLPMVLEQIHAFSSLKDERFREFFSIPTGDDLGNGRRRRHLWSRLTGMLKRQHADPGDP